MARRGSASLAAALTAALAAPGSLPAEIRHKVTEGGQIVAVNVPRPPQDHRAPAAPGGGGAPAPPVEPPPDIAEILEETSSRYGFDPAFISAVVHAESAFDPMAVSRKGARGLMQLMPGTARELGVEDVHDPTANLDAGVAYLRALSLKHPGRMDLALAAYNAGPEAVARYGGVPPYEETVRYISRIRSAYGGDLNRGDWSHRRGTIRVRMVDSGGVPHFTNMKRRRIIRTSAPARPPRQAPGSGGDHR